MVNAENSGNMEASDEKEPVKIVLAEDDIDDQELFAEALDATKIPSELTTLENGQELIDHLKDGTEPKPDLIFLDINMPVKGGKEALEEIKSDEELKEIPVVMLSTSDHPKDVEDTLNKGADLFVQKPNSFNSFILILKKIFNLFLTKNLVSSIKQIFFVSEKNIF